MDIRKVLLGILLLTTTACADTKVSQLPSVSSNSPTDLALTVSNPTTSPTTNNIQWGNVTVGKASALKTTPTQCNAGFFPSGIDVSGNAQNCSAATSSGSVTNIATTSPLTGGPITSSGTIAIQQANAAQSGYLSASDWNSFSSKLSGNQTITLGGILVGSGTTSITATAASGYYMPLTSDQTNWNAKQANLSLVAGTYVDGDICKYSSTGTLLNCNVSPAGTGTVTSIGANSPNKTIITTSTPVTSSGTIGYDINWTDVNAIAAINASGINWTSFPTTGFAKWNGSGTPTADTNTYLTGNQTITLSGDVSGSGSTAITTAIGNGKVTNAMLAGTIPVSLGGTGLATAPSNSLLLGTGSAYQSKTLSDCQDSAGNHLNFNATTGAFSCGSTGPSGNVTSVGLGSTAHTLTVTNTPITSSGTINADFNWTDINMINMLKSAGVNWTDMNINANLNMGGINWYDAQNLNQGVNWYNVTLVTKSVSTAGSGVGNIKLYDSTGTNWMDIAAPSTINGTSTWTLFGTRVNTVASSATPSINTDTTDMFTITALAAAITSMSTNLTGTPQNGQKLIIRILDNGTARAITWGSSFASRGVQLPTTTVLSKYLYVGFIYNSTTSTWDCVAVSEE